MNQPQKTSEKYDVFISYRHNPRDTAVAKRLMFLLEHLRRKGHPRLRVFRDKDELPTSGNLSKDLYDALENSRYLVLICSPEYLQSIWCRAEVLYFRQLHGNTNQNILPLLVAGEPVDSFPEELFTEEITVTEPDGTLRTETTKVEPLGADIRADSLHLMLRLLSHTEYLRIAAPVMGVRFDSLYQREQRRIRRLLALWLTGVAAVGTLFISFLLWQLFQVRQAQLHEKGVYAQQLFQSGDRLRARTESAEILSAVTAGMDKSITENARELDFLTSFTPELSPIVHIAPKLASHHILIANTGDSVWEYDRTGARRFDRTGQLLGEYHLTAEQLMLTALSPDGTRAAVLCRDENQLPVLRLLNTADGTVICDLLHCETLQNAENLRAEFSPDGSIVSVYQVGGITNSNMQLTLYNAQTGTIRKQLDGALLGTFRNDGVQDRSVMNFRFLGDGTAYWEGGAFHVFYSPAEDTIYQIPRNYTTRLAREKRVAPLYGRFLPIRRGNSIALLDFAGIGKDDFEAILADKSIQALDYTLCGQSTLIITETAGSSDFRQTRNCLSTLTILPIWGEKSGSMLTDLDKYSWDEWQVLSSDCSATFYLAMCDSTQNSTSLFFIDPEACQVQLISLEQDYAHIVYLDCIGDCGYFAGEQEGKTVLFCVEPNGSVRSRLVEASLTDFTSDYAIGILEGHPTLVSIWQSDFCLFSLENPAQPMDEQEKGSFGYAVSSNGLHWIRIGQSIFQTDAMSSKEELNDTIRYYGIGDNGTAFAASDKEIVLIQPDGTIAQRIEANYQDVLRNEVFEAVKLSADGGQLFWMSRPGVNLSNAISYHQSILSSMNTMTQERTLYNLMLHWESSIPSEHVYDCSPDGTQAAVLEYTSHSTNPQLTLLQAGQPEPVNRMDAQTLFLQDAMITGLCFADSKTILCTSRRTIAAVDAAAFSVRSRILETTDAVRMPMLLNGQTLCYFGSNLDVWNLDSGSLLNSIPAPGVPTLLPNADGSCCLLSTDSGTALYRTKDWAKLDSLCLEQLTCHRFDDDGFILDNGHSLYRWTMGT